mmetsp:Transcript_888/g.1925  ORF Transcript_888/g.1925 Transcript_888/m.1925 type:complete len:248 (-) Transcript_888:230-973(-)
MLALAVPIGQAVGHVVGADVCACLRHLLRTIVPLARLLLKLLLVHLCACAREGLLQVAAAEGLKVEKRLLDVVGRLSRVVPPQVQLCQARVARHGVGQHAHSRPANVVHSEIEKQQRVVVLEGISKRRRTLRPDRVFLQAQVLDRLVVFQAESEHAGLCALELVGREVQRDQSPYIPKHLRDDEVASDGYIWVVVHPDAVDVLSPRHLQSPHPRLALGSLVSHLVRWILELQQLVAHLAHAHVIHGV